MRKMCFVLIYYNISTNLVTNFLALKHKIKKNLYKNKTFPNITIRCKIHNLSLPNIICQKSSKKNIFEK